MRLHHPHGIDHPPPGLCIYNPALFAIPGGRRAEYPRNDVNRAKQGGLTRSTCAGDSRHAAYCRVTIFLAASCSR